MVELTWKNVEMTVSTYKACRQTKKMILNGVSGSVASGEMVALIGASGSGKTSLLNILAGRLEMGDVKGSVLVNNHKRSKAWRKMVGYVEQHDIMHEHLTVYETILNAARLKLPRSLEKSKMIERVQHVLNELGLEKCSKTLIGRISGGERKRVSIAVEMVTSPAFLLLDEPTSGLDSFTALSVIESLSKLVKDNKAVLITIHQPRLNILKHFTKLLLLSQGHVVFFGTLDSALYYFAASGMQCPVHENPVDFLLDNMIIDNRSLELRQVSENRVMHLIQKWHNVQISQPTHATDFHQPAGDQDEITKGASFITQLQILTLRNLTDYRRFKAALIALTLQTLAIALLVSIIFWQLDTSQASVQNRIGVLFFMTIQQTFAYVMPISIVFPTEKRMIRREKASNMYATSSVYLAKVISVIPQAIIATTVLSSIMYWTVGLQDGAEKFLIFLVAINSLVINSQALGMIIGAASPQIQVALIVGPMITLLFVIFAGNLLNTAAIPSGLMWITYISPCGYAYKVLMQNEFDGLQFDCPPDATELCFTSGEQVLRFYNLDALSLWFCFGMIWVLTLGFHIIGYVFLRLATRLPRIKP